MGSTRLPGKILKTVNGKPLLEYQLERVKQVKNIDQIVIATTIEKQDQPIVDFCESIGVDYYRGSEKDVLSRYYEAGKKFNGDIILRLTSDCPLIDPKTIDVTLQHYLNNTYDYVSNTIVRTFPRGLDTEVFSVDSLHKAYEEATLERDREHVTSYLYTHPEIFKIGYITSPKDYSAHRWTVDTIDDFQLIELILTKMYKPDETFHFEDVIEVINKHPEWFYLNAHIEQKKI